MTKQNKWKVPDGPKEEREENNKKEIEHLTRVIEDLEEKKASWEKGKNKSIDKINISSYKGTIIYKEETLFYLLFPKG